MVGTIYSARYRIGSSGTYTGITLSNSATQLPTTLSNYLYANYGGGIVGAAGTAWTVSNQGLIIDYGTVGNYGSNNFGGIVLPSGGEVINGNTGSEQQGQLTGTSPFYAYGRITDNTQGINIYGGAGTVINLGAIASSNVGITLASGGTIVNGALATSNATIAGASSISGGAGTVLNYGTIGYGGSAGTIGIDLTAGGIITNFSNAQILTIAEIDGGAGTVVNSGTLADTATLTAGGLIFNLAGGTILSGLYISGGAGTLTNAGLVSGLASFAANGTVTNTGTLYSSQSGVAIGGSGTLTNSGSIIGAQYGVDVSGTAALVTNYGTIESLSGQAAVLLQASGYILNQGLLLEQSGSVTAAAVSLKSGGTLVNNATLSGAPFGAYAQAATVMNNATIVASGYGGDSGVGVELSGALLVNNASIYTNWQQAVGTVLVNQATAVNNGVLIASAANTLGNLGNLVAVGAYVLSGGTLINTGTVETSVTGATSLNAVLNVGVLATGTLGVSIVNSGSIIGATGVVVARSQQVSVAGGYSIIDPKPNTTLIDSGLIDGTGGTAVQFGDGNTFFELMPSATLVGAVSFGSGSNTLGLGVGTGSLAGLGTTLSGLGTVDVFSGADWTLSGTIASTATLINSGTVQAGTAGLQVSAALVAGSGTTGTIAVASGGVVALSGAVSSSQTVQFLDSAGTLVLSNLSGFAGTISDFGVGDTLALAGSTATSAVYANNLLTISNGAQVISTLTLLNNATNETFATAQDSSGNTDITAVAVSTSVPCFAAGTRLRTTMGDVAVESLQLGTQMITESGQASPLIWLGHRRINCRTHPKPKNVLPIRIAAGAFAPHVPKRDVFLSPDHAVAWQNTLIPARYLVNGMTVEQVDVPWVDYWHVELQSHDILLAEELPAESYLDTGNRTQFDGGSVSALHADFSPAQPIMLAGPAIARVRAHLLDRARAIGYRPLPAFLHLQIGEQVISAASSFGDHHRFLIPGRFSIPGRVPTNKALHVAIHSDAWVPAERDPMSTDQRQLGVCVAGLLADGSPLKLDGAALVSGFHPLERCGATRWRWTDGRGVVHLSPAAKVLELRIMDDGVRAEAALNRSTLGR